MPSGAAISALRTAARAGRRPAPRRCAAHHHRRVEHVAGRRLAGNVRGADHLARLEFHRARGPPQAHDAPDRLDVVAGVHRREELDLVVGDEQALVAVAADQQLGGHVAEELEHLRAVDEIARVVGVVRAQAQADRAGDGLGHGRLPRVGLRRIHSSIANDATFSA
jgi:hypothetical protein